MSSSPARTAARNSVYIEHDEPTKRLKETRRLIKLTVDWTSGSPCVEEEWEVYSRSEQGGGGGGGEGRGSASAIADGEPGGGGGGGQGSASAIADAGSSQEKEEEDVATQRTRSNLAIVDADDAATG